MTHIKQIGDELAVRRAAANTAVTAGAGSDGAEVAGVIIDRAALGWPKSAVLAIPYTATLGEDETLSLAYVIAEGDQSNLSDEADMQTGAAAVVATGGTGGSTETGTFEVNVSLRGAGRYVRADFTPTMSASGTDTAALSAVLVFGAMERPE